MADRKTICLNMIVKNEAHIIEGTLEHLLKYMHFDYWVISDTGSTDKTKEIIRGFFKAKNIPGELQEEAWQDFGYNRTKAFEGAYGKADYAFVWDADDEIYGDFKMPENLTADSYKFIFGSSDGMRYSRPQLFNNRKRWCYKGVLHEYANCIEDCGPSVDVPGNYYFISGRRGDRSKDPNKYLKDALILEKASEKALAEGDPLYNRYIFYCAQSYNSCNKHEKAIEFYKKALTLPLWIQEKYVSCLEIYDQYDILKRAEEGVRFLVDSYKYDPTRIEGYYRLIKHYCINGPVEVAYAYYTVIQDFYENHYNPDTLGDKLFARRSEYDFYLPYYMIIVSDRVKRLETSAKMCEIIFKRRFVPPEWWLKNLFHNIQFCTKQLPLTLDFLESMLSYIDLVRQAGVKLEESHFLNISKIVDRYRELLSDLKPQPELVRALTERGVTCKKPTIMLTVTTCKRLDLFTKTINSILTLWTDVNKVDYFYCVDDNSSSEDRLIMQQQYPFFNYYMKTPKEKGHRESMNLIWQKLAELKPTYWIHLEDDWLYFKKESYVTRALEVLTKYESKGIHQVVFNKNYGLAFCDLDRVGGLMLDPATVLHEKREGMVGKNCAYWPHYSLQPSMIRTRVVLELGNYDSPNKFFERDYADRYFAKGYMTAFFNSIYSIHIGKQHWEKEGMNAYALNEIPQFNHADKQSVTNDTTITISEREGPFPLNGTMREHLDWFITKMKAGTPFGLIRPSDGERAVMLGNTLTNCDNWTFKQGGALQKDLLEAVKINSPNIFVGIPCNTCNKGWNCTQAIYNDFVDKFQISLAQRTYANIFMNSNWPTFIDFLKGYEAGFYLVTSGTQPMANLPMKERHVIDSKLVDRWDTEGSEETERVLQFIAGKKGQLILFSAGPLSKIWIPKCFEANPANMYVDVGAALDTFTKGTTTRLYTNPNHPFSKEACQFKDREAVKVMKSKKNLVYMCVFHNKDYMELLKILLATVKFYSKIDDIDFLVFTCSEFEPLVDGLATLLDMPIKTKLFNFTTMHESSCARLFIFDYEHVDSYEKVLYLDTDIIIQGDLAILFAQEIEDRVYAMKEGTIEHEYHGGWFFDFSKIDKNITGMNGGILLFKPSSAIREIFGQINEHIKSMKDEGKQLPACLDQPFLNYHLVKNDRHQTGFLEKYGLIYCYDPPPPPSAPTDVIMCHFVWPVGNARHKQNRMVSHVRHILNNYLAIKGDSPLPEFVGPDLSNNIYNWNDSGFIQLKPNNVLSTKWAPGKYKWLDSKTLTVSWSLYSHVLKMNDDYSRFLSLRLDDIDCSKGILQKYNPFAIAMKSTEIVTKGSYKYTAMIVEPRKHKALEFVLKNALENLSDEWCVIIYCSNTNLQFVKDIIHGSLSQYIARIQLIHLLCDNLTWDDCNGLISTNFELYKYITTEMFLKFETDSMIFSKYKDYIYEFMKYDYVGAPFYDTRFGGVGCGGQSLRNKAKMLEIMKTVKYMGQQEDVYFIDNKIVPMNIPSMEIAMRFSISEVFSPESFGCHMPKKSGELRPNDILLKTYPELKELYRLNGVEIHDSKEFIEPDLSQYTYSWNKNGIIRFEKQYKLYTSWGTGSYNWIDLITLEAWWGNFRHIITMNADYTEFTSIRKGDNECVKGTRLVKESPVHVFTKVYENCTWGTNESQEYTGSSGDGSFVEKNKEYIAVLKSFIQEKTILSVVDLGCGDWKCGKLIYDDLEINYTGYDAYEKVIDYNRKVFGSSKYSFAHLDFLNNTDKIQSADLCIIKDVLMHWPLEYIYSFLDSIISSKKFKYIMVTNCAWQEQDNTTIKMGEHMPLSINFLPLNKYKPRLLLKYNAKEVLLITVDCLI